MNNKQAQRIVDGYFNYVRLEFPQADRIGYLEIQMIIHQFESEMIICLGNGYYNTPWWFQLNAFISDLNARVKAKHPSLRQFNYASFSTRTTVIRAGGLLDEDRLLEQGLYPERTR
jgi:hypothetical protein